MRVPRPKLNAIELALFAGLVAVLGYMVGAYRTTESLRPYLSPGTAELQQIAEKYSGPRNSLNGEEWIVRDYFSDRRSGVFVDVGANHYRDHSNTYYLETQLGWSGVAIEPQSKFAADYALHRPLTRFVPLFVSDTSDQQATLYVPSDDRVASADRWFAEELSGGSIDSMATKTATLDDILTASGIRNIDFLSMDIELHEPQALRGFSIERFQPRLVCIEAHAAVRQQILDYFARHQYVVVGKYLRGDGANLWFAPLADTE
jgi:FkbM family methyltransferase